MKFIHISDLHIGKRINEYNLTEDQRYILDRIIETVEKETPDCVLIAGDVYDRTVPPVDAVELLDEFLVRLSALGTEIFVISGNHDSSERIAFGRKFMELGRVHISPVYNGEISPHILRDEHGEIAVYMLPFVKPSSVRPFVTEEISSYTDAVKAAVGQMNVDTGRRNVLIAHQFITGGDRTESEDKTVGGLDNVDATVFADFDYVALGHLHRPQNIGGSPRIRYSGTPLKYSASEVWDRKSVSVVTLGEKGSLDIREIPFKPLHDMYELRGTFEQLMDKSFYSGTDYCDGYTNIILTDEDEIPDAQTTLRVIYKRILSLTYEKKNGGCDGDVTIGGDAGKMDPLELFGEFFKARHGEEMNDEETAYVKRFINMIWGNESDATD